MINYAKIVTSEELEKLGLDKLIKIKQQAQIIKNKYDYEIHIKATYNAVQTSYTSYKPFSRIANEEIQKKEYQNETDIFKMVLKSNIVFPDHNKLYNILLDNKVNFKILLSISKRITNLKLLSQINKTINDILENKYSTDETNELIDNIFKILLNKKIILEIPKSKTLEQRLQVIKLVINKLSEKTNTDKNIEIIIKKLNYYYSLDEYETIITRLIQIVIYEKELYMDYENSKIKSFDKK